MTKTNKQIAKEYLDSEIKWLTNYDALTESLLDQKLIGENTHEATLNEIHAIVCDCVEDILKGFIKNG